MFSSILNVGQWQCTYFTCREFQVQSLVFPALERFTKMSTQKLGETLQSVLTTECLSEPRALFSFAQCLKTHILTFPSRTVKQFCSFTAEGCCIAKGLSVYFGESVEFQAFKAIKIYLKMCWQLGDLSQAERIVRWELHTEKSIW